MVALVCDICGGKLTMGAGGIATCESCGMEHSADRMKEKVQEIKGTVRVDNSHMIENYLEMAQNAKDAGNNSEAESYCNKIIEIDTKNYKAWMLKGEAAAWQSSLQNSRVDEGVTAFVKGINNAPEEEKEDLIEKAKDQIKNLSLAMISLRADRFAKWPDKEESTGFIADITSIFGTVKNFLTQTGVLIPISELMTPIATKINQSVVQAWQNVVWPDYNGDPNDSDDRAGKYQWQTFIERVGYCTTLVEKAISLCDDDDEDDIQRYENLIFMHKAAIDSCSWEYNYTDWGKSWHKKWMLTVEAKRTRRQWISQYEAKIKEIKASVAAKEAAEKAEKERIARERFESYWVEHASEKISLENEIEALKKQIKSINKTLDEQVASLEQEIETIPEKKELDCFWSQIMKLNEKMNNLGIFKGKEKKALRDQIDRAKACREAIKEKIDVKEEELEAQIALVRVDAQNKISQLQDKIANISNDLIKAR